MTATLAPVPFLRFTDTSTGLALVGGLVYTYVAGTTTPQPTYTDSSKTTANTNPIVLNSRGECSCFLDASLTYKIVVKDALGNTILTQDNIPGSPFAYVTAGNGIGDDTTRLQAVIDGAPTGSMILLGPGVFRYTTLTISKPLTIRGSGMAQSATLLQSTSATLDGIVITTNEQVELSDFCMNASVTRTAGAFIKVGTVGVANALSLFHRLELVAPFTGINFVSATTFTVNNCYFPSPVSAAITVANAVTADAGDSTITDCVFDLSAHAASVGINQASSGGLRVLNNKFLGGAFQIICQMTGQTSILIVTGNSMEAAVTANIALTGTNPITFSKVVIDGNQFSINPSATGISITDPGYSFLDDLTVGGNTFNLGAGSQGISLGRGIRISILPNSFIGNGAGNVGIVFTLNATAMVWPQNMPNVATRYTGNFTGITFVPGGLVQSGASTSTVTNTAYGNVFKSATNTVVFPVAYPKAPSLRAWNTDVGGGVGIMIVDGSISATQFQYQAVGSAVGSLPKIAWEASGG